MKGSAITLILALCVVAACGQSTPPSTAIDTSTVPPPVEPSPTAVESTEASSTATGLPTDAPQPTPEGLLRLTNDPARDQTPAWSWDGQRIAFSSDRTGVFEIYAMNADGGSLVELTEDSGVLFKEDPAWSPDGRRIAFTALFDVSRILAFEVDIAEAEPFSPSHWASQGFPEPLSDYYTDSFFAAWSPDGRTLALIMHDANLVRQLFTLDPASGRFTQLTNGTSPAYRPSWSPDGRRIAYSLDAEGDQEIYVIGADGGGLTQLTNDPGYDSRPSWSPDGRLIVFSSDRGGAYRLHLMWSDGSYIGELDTGPGEAFTPSWSPDGRFIAFVSDRDGNDEIYRMDAPALQP